MKKDIKRADKEMKSLSPKELENLIFKVHFQMLMIVVVIGAMVGIIIRALIHHKILQHSIVEAYINSSLGLVVLMIWAAIIGTIIKRAFTPKKDLEEMKKEKK